MTVPGQALVFFLRPDVPGFCPSMGDVLSLVTARDPDKAFSATFLGDFVDTN